jgi:hypothetical protein
MSDEPTYRMTIKESVDYRGVFNKSTEYRVEVDISGDGDELSKIAVAVNSALSNRSVDAFER